MKKGMKHFCVAVFIVLAGVCVIDITVGKVMDWMLPQISNQGDTGKTYYSLNEINTQIVIVGSSRAAHHYVTSMISDSLGIAAKNIGRDGCFFSYNCCVINSILDRYTPKIIIWENSMDCLFEESDDPLEDIYPYYKKNIYATKYIYEDENVQSRIVLFSSLYKYNSLLERIVIRYKNRKSFVDNTHDGYMPLTTKVLKTPLTLLEDRNTHETISPMKELRFTEVVSRAKQKGVCMVVVDSPMYRLRNSNNNSEKRLKEICDSLDVQIIDNTQLPDFLEHPEYFNDITHLNTIGASKYTECVVKQLIHF